MEITEQAPEGTTVNEYGDMAVGPETVVRHNGKDYGMRDFYKWIDGRWEGAVSMWPLVED